MSENPIGVWKAQHSSCWYWQHADCDPFPSFGVEWTAGEAGDVGREHMRRFHGYSRRCGVSLAACEAQTCQCVPVDPDAMGGREKPVCDFGDDFPCCTHDNPLQTAYDTTRRDA